MALLVSDLDTLRDALGVKKMILLGYSFGGQIALEYAPAHPDHVAGLILEAASDDLFGERTAITQLAGFGIVAKGDLRNDIARIAETTEATT
jgi:proline iminopeptidase